MIRAGHTTPHRPAGLAVLLLLIVCGIGGRAGAAPPPEGECPAVSAEPGGGPPSEDAVPILIREGMRIEKEGILILQSLLPEEVWRHREVFFFEGMFMEIGPCHRRYAIQSHYRDATERHAGRAKIDRSGNLKDYVAGAPFPQASIDPKDPQAAAKWAWNLEKRWRGAGHRGRFRITNLPTRMGPTLRFTGDFFTMQVAERADMPETGYGWKGSDKMLWAVGGEFRSPFSARGLAWRQFRVPKAQKKWRQSDDVFVYVPSLRKMRRSGTNWVDGAFVPRYTIAGQTQGGGGVPLGEGGAINPGAGTSLAVSEDARTGLTGLHLRPNAYHWRLRGEQTVIAPINGVNGGWPKVEERNYGYSGLSVAGDRWDVRQAVVIEGALRKEDETIKTVTIYVDHDTLQPLYWVSRTSRRRLVEVGILVHRYTGDVAKYPVWSDGSPTYVFEPIAASFLNALAGRGGWLRESHDLLSTPYTDSERKRMTTNHALGRGH